MYCTYDYYFSSDLNFKFEDYHIYSNLRTLIFQRFSGLLQFKSSDIKIIGF